MDTNNFPSRLRAARQERGWTQEELAAKIGVDARAVRRWEAGEATPRKYHQEKLVSIFNISKIDFGFEKDIQNDKQKKIYSTLEEKGEDKDDLLKNEILPSNQKQLPPSSGTPNPPILRKKWRWFFISFLCLLILGIVVRTYYFLLYRVDPSKPPSAVVSQSNASSFASVVQQGAAFPISFSSGWDDGEQTGGFCSPNAKTNEIEVVARKNHGIFSCMYHSSISQNVALQVQVNVKQGDKAGIAFRDSRDPLHRYYLYRIYVHTGEWDLSKGTGSKQDILSGSGYPQISTSIMKGNNVTNLLGIIVVNKTIYLYVNHHLISRFTEKAMYETGTIGMYVGEDPGSVTYSSITSWEFAQNFRIEGS